MAYVLRLFQAVGVKDVHSSVIGKVPKLHHSIYSSDLFLDGEIF